MSWYLAVFRKYADFSGRARRMEYWMWVLMNIVIIIPAYILLLVLGMNEEGPTAIGMIILGLLGIYYLAILIPGLAVAIRRLHDSDKSGWFFLVNFIPGIGGLIFLILMILPGTQGDNRFGPDPLNE